MRRLLITIAAASLLATQQAAATPPSHSGRWITDRGGRVLVLHGLNMVSKLPPYAPAGTGFGTDDAAFLARRGFDVVRLGVIFAAVEPRPGRFDEGYLASIASTVRKLSARGIYTLLDFHQDQYNERFHGEGFPDWAVQDDGLPHVPDLGFPANYTSMASLQRAFDHFWADSAGPGGVGLQERYAAAWGRVAKKFARNSRVLGYDLFNEPWPGTNWPPCLAPAGCPAFDAQLAAMQRKSLRAIRRADRRHIVWYEPNVLFNFGNATHLPDFGDPRTGMSFHDYCTGGPPSLCVPAEKKTLANAVARSHSTGDALLLSEFGATTDVGTLTRIEDDADAQLMPWIEWAFCGCGDPTGSIPTSSEAVVLDPHKPPRGSNLQAGTLRALERPYPQSLAGTPSAFRFDGSSGRFTLAYSTKRPRGAGRFPAGSCSVVFVPSMRYPHGYRVSVRGARVISPRGDGALELASKRAARRIALRLTPAAHGHTGPPTVTRPACASPG